MNGVVLGDADVAGDIFCNGLMGLVWNKGKDCTAIDPLLTKMALCRGDGRDLKVYCPRYSFFRRCGEGIMERGISKRYPHHSKGVLKTARLSERDAKSGNWDEEIGRP